MMNTCSDVPFPISPCNVLSESLVSSARAVLLSRGALGTGDMFTTVASHGKMFSYQSKYHSFPVPAKDLDVKVCYVRPF